MKFRPCIDIHNGKVKQIVGGSLSDQNSKAVENFVSEQDAGFYAALYKKDNLSGGHIILLNPIGTDYYIQDCNQAKKALKEFPQGMQIGGGITEENAVSFIEQGASHVIVTSYVFKGGKINFDNLNKLVSTVGKEKLVLDLSCRKRNGEYYIVTDRWQKFTDVVVNQDTLDTLSEFCDEFLVHAVDVEGKASGIETELVELLGRWNKIPITYAGGVSSLEDLNLLKELGKDKLDVTIGSALDLFGGSIKYSEVVSCTDQESGSRKVSE
ncbi:phosphoribosylformimino-5-aminoimidazole carboxamide ribotide isomerase [Anaerocolumna sedimenticola]|uniref:Phosphoribosylformimino-5-aminoimidazole carboxamide ribotide isomerase n=1 Tax=Anaerocolumna sedimenticola TaxID=2696063 RepID=A0A6P1TK50_9FIRM|nr:phosphoribosylformimino-5-aminoimidazole carboxamide ribotide isomerase [Anaerocolumna sedimenticola]QHQ59648.1 phosphoribosylformimino-5-aminoimidazole carboxamide ribotide isomerase [Anaerocolumna sedimenticola]